MTLFPDGKKEFVSPDPFITDVQARRMGYDLSRIPTRRIEAKFALMDRLEASRIGGAPPPIIVKPFRGSMSLESSSTLEDELIEGYDAQLPVLGRGHSAAPASPHLMTPVLTEAPPPGAVQAVSQPEGEYTPHFR